MRDWNSFSLKSMCSRLTTRYSIATGRLRCSQLTTPVARGGGRRRRRPGWAAGDGEGDSERILILQNGTFPTRFARSACWKWKTQMFAHSATALRSRAARAWGPFGCRFGRSGRDRISMDRGSGVEIFGARWAEIEEGDGRDFRLRFPRLLTRT